MTPGAHFAAPIFRILSDSRQQFAGPGRLDHGNGAVAGRLGQLRIERHGDVQALAGVGIDDSEQRRIGAIQIRLVKRDLPA